MPVLADSLAPISLPGEQVTNPTILPTDVAPLAGPAERSALSDDFQIALLNKLPSRFYFNFTCESTFRLETNPFQMPSKSSLIYKATGGQPLYVLSAAQRVSLNRQLSEVNASQQIYRIVPNLTAGWSLSPSTRVYTNYFVIRDTAFSNSTLDTTVQSLAMGIQHDIPLSNRFNLQGDFQGRELYQTAQIPVFDYIPSLTLSYIRSARTVAFVSTLMQLRGRQPFVAPNREIDPFYSFGVIHRRGKWSFSTYATFVQNFRQPFGGNAYLPVNNYQWIADFEVARNLSNRLPAQAFVRAEPVFNLHSNATPGLSGNDFRLFYGLRMQFGKQSLLAARQSIDQELKEIHKFKTIDSAQDREESTPQSTQNSNQPPSNINLPATQNGNQPSSNIDAPATQNGNQPSSNINAPATQNGNQPSSNINAPATQNGNQPSSNINAPAPQNGSQPSSNINAPAPQNGNQPHPNINAPAPQNGSQPSSNINPPATQNDNELSSNTNPLISLRPPIVF